MRVGSDGEAFSAGGQTGESGVRGKAVLLFEPEPSRQSRLARMLTVCGHRVVGTSSIDGALALLSQFSVDILLIAEECDAAQVRRVVSRVQELRPGARVAMLGAEDASGSHPSGLPYLPRPARMDQVAAVMTA